MKAVIKVPRWVIAQVCLSAGRRLPKREKFSEPAQTSLLTHKDFKNIWSGNKDLKIHSGKIEWPKWAIVRQDPALKFDHSEYALFAVDVQHDRVINACCRVCDDLIFTQEEKREHHNRECKKILRQAFHKLSVDARCVICDKRTSSEKWGVPLCVGTNCEDEWMHENARPRALDAAIELVMHLA